MHQSPFKAQSQCASIANSSEAESDYWPTPVQRLRRTRIRAVSSDDVRSVVSGELFEQIGLFAGDARQQRLKLKPSGEMVSDLLLGGTGVGVIDFYRNAGRLGE